MLLKEKELREVLTLRENDLKNLMTMKRLLMEKETALVSSQKSKEEIESLRILQDEALEALQEQKKALERQFY